ncbi:MAG: D-glycero-beta-D-manno-heptose-7-phosphate kinase [Calditrichia bacterium]
MIYIGKTRLQELTQTASHKKIIVIGDLMVDEYLWGKVTRISPEAPVPIIGIDSEQIRFGGAANVAYNLIGLHAHPILMGVVGDDRMGEIFQAMLRENNLPSDGVIVSPDRPTTVKTRIIGNNQHIARVDKESTEPISAEMQDILYEKMVDYIDEVEAVIIQDYNKGVIVPNLVERITNLANRHGKYITVDPKFENFLTFKEVTLFKPNTKEAEEALAIRIRNDEDFIAAGKCLLKKLECKAVLITRGSRGMALFQNDGEITFVDARARKVADVSGAGDTVIATFTYALCGGASMKEAVTMANYAAGLVCEEVGVVPVELEKLQQAILKDETISD